MTKRLFAVICALMVSLALFVGCEDDPALYLDHTTPHTTAPAPVSAAPDTTNPAEPPVSTGSPGTTAPTVPPETTPPATTEKHIDQPHNAEGTPSFYEGVMTLNDRVMELFGLNEDGLTGYADKINRLRGLLPADVTLYSMVCPTASEFYTPEEFHTGGHSQRAAIDIINSKLDAGVTTIDCYDTLLQHYEEPIYFKTDHHWSGLGAYYAYQAFCEQTGQVPVPLSDYDQYDLGEYAGTLFGYANGDPNVVPDRFIMYRPKDYDASAWVYETPAMEGGFGMHLFATTWSGSEHYLAFSGGDAPIMKITSHIKNGKKILVIKDSFAKAFLPHLANNYEYVYEIDPRHFEGSIPQFVAQEGIGEVMVTNYTLATGNPTWLAGFDAALVP